MQRLWKAKQVPVVSPRLNSEILPHLEMFMTSLQFICEKIPRICDDQYQNEATNGLIISQVNVSNSIQVI